MGNTNLIELSASEFEAEVLKSDIPVLVDFWAPWCGPCRMVVPLMQQIADEYEGKAKVCKVNVDDEGALAAKFGVMTIPTVFVFSGGEIAEQVTGAYPKARYAQMLDKALSK